MRKNRDDEEHDAQSQPEISPPPQHGGRRRRGPLGEQESGGGLRSAILWLRVSQYVDVATVEVRCRAGHAPSRWEVMLMRGMMGGGMLLGCSAVSEQKLWTVCGDCRLLDGLIRNDSLQCRNDCSVADFEGIVWECSRQTIVFGFNFSGRRTSEGYFHTMARRLSCCKWIAKIKVGNTIIDHHLILTDQLPSPKETKFRT